MYAAIQSQVVMTITDIDSVPLPLTERILTFSGNQGMCYGTNMRKAHKFF